MKPACGKVKNPCKFCLQPVSTKNGLQCMGACKRWAHFKCLCYTPGKIADIKAGIIKVTCPCPDCATTQPKEFLTNPPFVCSNHECPANKAQKCDSYECPSNRPNTLSFPNPPCPIPPCPTQQYKVCSPTPSCEQSPRSPRSPPSPPSPPCPPCPHTPPRSPPRHTCPACPSSPSKKRRSPSPPRTPKKASGPLKRIRPPSPPSPPCPLRPPCPPRRACPPTPPPCETPSPPRSRCPPSPSPPRHPPKRCPPPARRTPPPRRPPSPPKSPCPPTPPPPCRSPPTPRPRSCCMDARRGNTSPQQQQCRRADFGSPMVKSPSCSVLSYDVPETSSQESPFQAMSETQMLCDECGQFYTSSFHGYRSRTMTSASQVAQVGHDSEDSMITALQDMCSAVGQLNMQMKSIMKKVEMR